MSTIKPSIHKFNSSQNARNDSLVELRSGCAFVDAG